MSENEQIILLLIEVNKNLKKLRKHFKSERKKREDVYNPADWGFKEEVLKNLTISKSTLYRWRSEGLVRWEKKGGTCYYYLPDLIRLKNRCMK